MRAKKIFSSAMAVSLIALTACAGSPYNQYGSRSGIGKTEVGTVLGGVGGALLGSQIGGGSGRLVATAAGTLLGAAIGSEIGASMDKTDIMYHENTAQESLEYSQVGESSSWRNPDSGHYGTITPVRTYEQAGRYCREYNQTVSVGGRTERAYGTACRQPDGTWELVS